MVVTRNMDARLEALEKAMEEQANHLTAIEAKLDERAAIQKSQFDQIRQQLAALGYLLGHKELAPIPAFEETTKAVNLPPPVVATPPTIVTVPLVLSTQTPPVIATAHLAPYNHVVLPTQPPPPPPHLPFALQRFSPLLAIQQQPTIFLPVSYASQLLLPAATMSNPVYVHFVTPLLPHIMILLKELLLRLLCLAGMDLSVHPSVGWLKSSGKQIDVRPWKIWAVF